MQKIAPCLWFDDHAEEAARFYTSVFKNSRITGVARYGAAAAKAAGRTEGSVMSVTFQLEGQDFMALNGGPRFDFSPALSLMANCETQQEIDALWQKLSEGGEEQRCGWVRDRYGVSWQVVPASVSEMMAGEEPNRADAVMQAILQMTKIDLGALERAYQQNRETPAS